ncbi:MAG TPA: M2 family metallopeptidase [Anaeromyxobacteraceae bacterium]|nr:M2 family metallopeptidase [Anaeromyxobacteraceae bacterium]
MRAPSALATALLAVLVRPAAAQAPLQAPPGPASTPTPAEATAFVQRVNEELKRLTVRAATADWIKATDITDDTERNSAAMNEDLMAYLSRTIPEAARFDGAAADPETRRMLHLLKLSSSLPAPRDPARRRELAEIAARLEGLYGKGKWCDPPSPGKAPPACHDILETETIFQKSRDEAALRRAWLGWHSISREMKPLYARLVELGDEGAREIGFEDLGALWRSGYDMTPAELEADVDRLWREVKPLYDELHCYVRGRLQRIYGKGTVPDGKPIPAHLLGNIWAQEWSNLAGDLEPYPGVGSIDLTAALRRQRYDAVKMARRAEGFFTSLGLQPLPKTFWERSMLTKPRDREVVCHASAWDVTSSGDLRIKMCIRPIEEDFITIHHELGHNYYQRAYVGLPFLLQGSANDGFHEALGDTISPLSMTPAYLQSAGLIAEVPRDERAVLNHQMRNALEGIAFLPFGRLVDQWRWEVFSGRLAPDRYNARWWELRRIYQGVDAPAPRDEARDFDPGAKYHVPANVPYLRYFLARIYQYQFHQALCRASGWKGPLHQCSIFGSKEAGKRLQAMMAMGASRPWPDAMEALTGQRRADAGPLVAYYAPLREWLRARNAGRTCGW